MIEVLVGMIGSGKSTYARERAKGHTCLVVCHDDLVGMLHCGDFYEKELKRVYREMEEAVASLAVESGRDLIIDRTNLSLAERKRWVKFARDRGRKVVAVAFPIERVAVHAQRRWEADPRGLSYPAWYEIAFHHAGQARDNPLGPGEGFDEIRLVGEHSGEVPLDFELRQALEGNPDPRP